MRHIYHAHYWDLVCWRFLCAECLSRCWIVGSQESETELISNDPNNPRYREDFVGVPMPESPKPLFQQNFRKMVSWTHGLNDGLHECFRCPALLASRLNLPRFPALISCLVYEWLAGCGVCMLLHCGRYHARMAKPCIYDKRCAS